MKKLTEDELRLKINTCKDYQILYNMCWIRIDNLLKQNTIRMNEKPYRVLLGNRIYLELPKQEESKVIVDENTKEALMKEFSKKLQKVVVYDKGETVNNVEIGDVVMADHKALSSAPVIDLGNGTTVILVSPFDIVHIW